MKNLKISIITVSYNAVETIEETILSVLNQSYNNIEYIIIDGGSIDGTVDIIKKYENKINYWISEADNGMYDALVKGFSHITGDICAYINADDYYQLYAFDIVNEIFQNKEVKWITGINTWYNNKSQITGAVLPYRYRNNFIIKGIYNGKDLPFIQQESVFWRTELNDNIDFDKLRNFNYAGDYYLWMCFSKVAKLDIVMTIFSGFRKHRGQLSENLNKYLKEMNFIIEMKKNFFDRFIILMDKIKGKMPLKFNKNIIIYNHISNRWEKNNNKIL